MKWYEGGIAQAVALSQSQKAVFFVGIFGTDGTSQELETALNSDEVQVVLASDEFVCLRLEAESEPHKQFAAIYANAKTPSIYCITDKGVPVEIITESLPTAELRERLESARNRHREVLGIKVQGSSPTTFAVPPQPALVSTATASNATTKTEETKEPERSESSGSSSENQGPAFEEKVRRAKELALARQLQKQKEEEEDERRKEIERRQAGKGMAELQRWQKEQEAKKILEERKKEREEEKLVRQRLREQIAQDRAARNARSNIEFVEQASSSVPKPTVTSNAAAAANYAGQARLQFRLPDGSSQTHAFSPDSTLGHVRQFLIDGNAVPFRNFSIWVAFPRRQFTSAEYGNTLRELGLLPSAALLILPESGLSNTRSGGSDLWALIAYLLGYILYPVSFIWSVLQRALPSSTTGTDSNPSSSSTTASTETPKGSVLGRGNKLGGRAPTDGRGDQGSSPSATASSSDNPAGKAKDKSSSANSSSSSSSSGGSNSGKNLSSPDGNVHRLRTKESDSDDEKATWNGNSTQQM